MIAATDTGSNVIPFPVVTVAAEADTGTHGWHVRARRDGNVIHYRNAFGLRSVARDEAKELAARRLFWWHE